MTLSPGAMGRSWRNKRASASTNPAADRCETATPLGVPVEPDVKITQASSAGSGDTVPTRPGDLRRDVITSPLPITAATSASPNTVRAR